MSFVEPFIIMDNAEARCEVQEFTVVEAKLLAPWMSMLEVVVHGKGFVEQHAAGLERLDQVGEERSAQIKEYENGVVRFMSKIRLVRGRLLQVERSCRNPGEVPRSCAGRKLRDGVLIAIDGIDLIAQRREKERVAPASGRDVEDLPFGKTVELLDKKPCRRWVRSEKLLREPGALHSDPDGSGDVGDRWMKLPQPQLDAINGKFVEEGRQESFSHRFQQPRIMTDSKFNHALSHFRVVDRVQQVVGLPRIL